MWFHEPQEIFSGEKITFDIFGKISIITAVAGTLIFGLYPNLFFTIFNFVIK
jgi:hypothetical protein